MVRPVDLLARGIDAIAHTRGGFPLTICAIITIFAIPIILSLAGIGVGSWLWASGTSELAGRYVLFGGICGLTVFAFLGGASLLGAFSIRSMYGDL